MTTQEQDHWMRHMLAGDFEQAWQVSDRLVRAGLHQPVWKGQSFNGQRVLIRCLHGLGDTIQFIRYARMLKEAGARSVAAQMHPELVDLISTAPGLDLAFSWDGTVDFDLDIEIMELPWAFRSTTESLPGRTPYLRVHSELGVHPEWGVHPESGIHPEPGSQQARNRSRCASRVGLVWSSSQWDLSRSIPLSALRPLAPWRPISLQHGGGHREADSESWIEYAGEQSSLLLDTAADVSGVSLLITVDTMVAHLAGALGVPAWILLKYDADWRWMRGRCDSPWYPTVRLFRQRSPGNWASAVREVEIALAESTIAASCSSL